MRIYGGIESGGTKFICAVATSPQDVRAEIRIPTTNPEETLKKTIAFFQDYEQSSGEQLAGIGISSFGPVDLNPSSPTYGYITSTPKPGWNQTDELGPIQAKFHIDMAFDTDTNGAAIGEATWGAAQNLNDFLYLTIGTGIGGGGLMNGEPLHGMVHPEVGHIRIPHNFERDPFPGSCPYHGDCFEGLASGPAIEKRWKTKAENLPVKHPAWQLEADYIAISLHNYICEYSPQRIILGGGVMQQEFLFPMIRKKVLDSLAGYIQSPSLLEHIDAYIVPPGLGDRAGVMGAIAMIKKKVENSVKKKKTQANIVE
jgi:fructokinase